MLKNFLLAGAGGMVGSMLRYAFYVLLKTNIWTTFSVNIIGSFLIGLIVGYAQRMEHPQNMQLLLATGLCGGFTTFSAFSADNLRLFNEGSIGTALGYTALSIVLGVLFTFIGYKLV
ncbi:MAG TPA: CrcB family protein [Chitinophagaceae bacterium]|nr:CrcB family protein [Chitinophagaceae bacterium]